jgi:adiponectin receptor
VCAYLAAGAFVVAPLIHSIVRWGIHSDQVRMYVNDGYLGLVAFLYVLGAYIYISRFPEKLYPGRFDLLFASHQIWHALVFAAAYVHYFGAVELYLWRVELELQSSLTINGSSVRPI